MKTWQIDQILDLTSTLGADAGLHQATTISDIGPAGQHHQAQPTL